MATRKTTANRKPKADPFRDCYHCKGCKCDARCGYWCETKKRVVPVSEVSEATTCDAYKFDKTTVIGYDK